MHANARLPRSFSRAHKTRTAGCFPKETPDAGQRRFTTGSVNPSPVLPLLASRECWSMSSCHSTRIENYRDTARAGPGLPFPRRRILASEGTVPEDHRMAARARSVVSS